MRKTAKNVGSSNLQRMIEIDFPERSKSTKRRTSLFLRKDLIDRIEEIAEETGLSTSALVEKAIEIYLERLERGS